MKKIKHFPSDEQIDLDKVLEALQADGIKTEVHDADPSGFDLYVHVGSFIKARDIVIDTLSQEDE